MVDPNNDITGKGIMRLEEANIDVQMYPKPFREIIVELNREFIRDQKKTSSRHSLDTNVIELLSKRSLDQWYITINKIYWNRNYYQGVSQTFSHLVEVIGGLSFLASEKKKEEGDPETYMPKAIAWWLALCGKLGVKSVEEMLWNKFPSICPYCQMSPHVDRACKEKKQSNKGPNWSELKSRGKGKSLPQTIGDWQLMFDRIYPGSSTDIYPPVFARLVEELGELSEAIRVFSAEPGYFLSEACDVFAWLMRIQNMIDDKHGNEFGTALNAALSEHYPEKCLDCNATICACPPILKSTIGRIAHEVPITKNSDDRFEHFLTVAETSEKFGNF
jgi:hypothetical protein